MRFWWLGLAGVTALTCGGCPEQTTERNPYLTYVETFGVSAGVQEGTGGGAEGSGSDVTQTFRLPLTLSFFNAHAGAILETSFIAWVGVESLRSADQQDALLRTGYTQLTKQISIGTVLTLPVGTFVYGGPGLAGTSPVVLGPAAGEGDSLTPTQAAFEITTPDGILVYSQPPVSCDSVAFTFLDPLTGDVLDGAATMGGGYKTLAQVDSYTCEPFKPGVFFNNVGGQFQSNEFEEGQAVTFTFLPGPVDGTQDGAYAIVTIGTLAETEEP